MKYLIFLLFSFQMFNSKAFADVKVYTNNNANFNRYVNYNNCKNWKKSDLARECYFFLTIIYI